jgi:4-diphosphocytidyl-2-C-methyl-D-erythritol kinase
LILEAPAKLNLCLFVGPLRTDGLHEIRSIFQPLDLADRIEVTEDAAEDEVLCPTVDGPELASRALEALRERGWNGPHLRIEIDKRIPVAAGLGGGSADAAAVLRLAEGDLGIEVLRAIGAELGADVPSQLDPRPALVSGAGERVQALGAPGVYGIVLIPFEPGLPTGDVYAELDRLGSVRDPDELVEIEERLLEAAAGGDTPHRYEHLLVNDLQPAAISLRPEIAGAIEALEGAGAARALVTGSGPTVFGLFEDVAAAQRARESLTGSYEPIVATPRIGER